MSLITYFVFNLACMFEKNLAHHHIKQKDFEKNLKKEKKEGAYLFKTKSRL